jgi:hypothetical protein
MHGLRSKAKAQVGRLLRILLLRLGAVSANSGRTLRRTGRGLLLCVTSNDQRVEPSLARLVRELAHQLAGVVATSRRDSCWFVCSCICSSRDLDHRPHLEGHGVHIEREAVQSHALPIHRPLLSCDDRSSLRVGHGGHFHRHLWMDFLGRVYCRRERAHMVGHRADMGEVLLVREPDLAQLSQLEGKSEQNQ